MKIEVPIRVLLEKLEQLYQEGFDYVGLEIKSPDLLLLTPEGGTDPGYTPFNKIDPVQLS